MQFLYYCLVSKLSIFPKINEYSSYKLLILAIQLVLYMHGISIFHVHFYI